ncbi:LacI family DNA-binding transcriptional regulator [Tunturiibacter gelidoferens]|uniref:LacI family transcriptional regulator n=4 Tax=Tunturiibacter TaxID=3154218 RepID=A0A7Y9NJH2_9BACT|nr:LacI family DNA-binding transcriptional regulator [Edaphobacter lichenicola]NYF50511.1 LacI family transcriptional regulator [Edaphobacter lichenicola]
MSNMKEIARLAEVSLGTVSNVLNNSAKVREPLRRRVLAAVDSLRYEPSQLARGLRRDKTNMIGMIIPDITNPFFPAVVRGAEDAAFGSGYRLVLCNADNNLTKEVSYMNQLRTYLPTGIIVIPSNFSEITMQAGSATRGGAVVVCLDRMPRHWKGDTVTVANDEGALNATQHLIQLGHKRIATITGPLQLTIAHARLAGFRRALKQANIQIPAEYVQESSFDRAGGYSAALGLLQLKPRPTAIFAQNDMIAMGVVMAIRELGLRCPHDVSLFGFDGLEVTELMDPPLSSVLQPGYQLGSLGVQLLLERVSDPNRPFRHHVLPTELRLGASIAPPPPTRQSKKKPDSAPRRKLAT